MKEKIYLSPPHMTGNEQQFINDAFKSNWIAPLGPHVDKFERDMEIYLGAGHAVAMISGTSAIHLALILLGVGPGDIVLCSSMTFVASANPILYLGATPVFVDSEEESWNICPLSLDQAIKDQIKKGQKPKALIAVDLLGQPADYDKISKICDHYDIKLIEDSAESLGASYKNKKCGLFGDFGIFSFNGNKIISTSGGGMLICHSKEVADKAKYLITQARDDAPYYKHSTTGYNYRMSNILAGVGIAQLEALDERVSQKINVFNYYREALSKYSFLNFIPQPSETISNRWLSSLLIDKEVKLKPETIITALENENIEARRLWKPLHSQPLFKNCNYYSNGESFSDFIFERGFSLPSGSQLTNNQLERIISIVKPILDHVSH
jgi:pyridoxal phosphate-dependent aminotransferase EpsN